MKAKKVNKQLCPYITAKLKQRNITHTVQNFDAYSVVYLEMPAAAWNDLVEEAKYHVAARRVSSDEECYLPVVSIRTLKSGRKMHQLQKLFGTHCFFIKEEQAETLKYLYA